MESRVELFALIRRDARVKGLLIRALAVRHGVHRRTVRQALVFSEPPERKPRQGVSRKLESFKPAIDAMLVGDTMAPRKQRHTAWRVLARLIEEHGGGDLMWRSWERLRREAGTGGSDWWLPHADPHLRVLLDPETGPFYNCDGEHAAPTLFVAEYAPSGWFPDERLDVSA